MRNMSGARMITGAAAILALGACAQEQANIVLDDRCAAGVRWAGVEGDPTGQSEEQLRAIEDHVAAPEMHPGRDCVACHSALSHGPDFVIAGTVYMKRDEASDCGGVHSATVIVKDAAGVEYRLASNGVGNFYLRRGDAPDFKPPYQVRLLHGGTERPMYSPQTEGSCNRCHTAQGDAPAGQGSPSGRVCVDPNDLICAP